MKRLLTAPQATVLAAIIVVGGAVFGHLLTFWTKERDRKSG